MKRYDDLVKYFDSEFDLSRIANLADKDKFRLINYMKLVYRASEEVKISGLTRLENSKYYKMDYTFHFMITVVHANLSSNIIEEIIHNYNNNFYNSDVYYAKMLVLGGGALMIKEGVDSKSILNYQRSLLGKEFAVKYNAKYQNEFEDELKLEGDNQINIRYRDLDHTFRKLKYEMLALLKIRKDEGRNRVSKIVNEKYGNKDLIAIFNIINCDDNSYVESIYRRLSEGEDRNSRLLLTASRCIVKDYGIMETHYLLNSIIGKYSRIDKPYEEVMDEINDREKELLAL